MNLCLEGGGGGGGGCSVRCMHGSVCACSIQQRAGNTRLYYEALYLFSHNVVTAPSDNDTHSWSPNMIMHFFLVMVKCVSFYESEICIEFVRKTRTFIKNDNFLCLYSVSQLYCVFKLKVQCEIFY